MKEILLEIISNDHSYNKSATRYLYKTHPKIWDEILQLTSFLPDDAAPKQRVWHILNDIYKRPVCPVTKEFLKWREKKYDKYSSVDAKNRDIGNVLSKVLSNGNHWRKKDQEKSKLANEKFSTGLTSGRITIDRSKRDSKTIYNKSKITWMKKYGVDNPAKSLSVRNKISKLKIEKGATPKHLRSLRKLYYDSVWYFTEQSWKNHFDKINPLRIDRSKNALDHIFSIQQGFIDNIPPYIIGHWTNLRIITLSENSKKGMKCFKTQDDLFTDFFNNIV